jgi:serine/threonine protein phosphatase PrpC
MPVNCPSCGQTSQDIEFCDHCNQELGNSDDSSPELIKEEIRLETGTFLTISLPRDGTYGSGSTIPCDSESHRVFIVDDATIAIRESQAASRSMLADVLPLTEIHKVNGQHILVVHGDCNSPTWVLQASELDEADHLWKYMEQLRGSIAPVVQGLERLHENGFVCLTFNPSKIRKTESGVVFCNLDVFLYGMHQCPEKMPVSAAFSPPEVHRFDARKIDASTDVFHVAAWLYYLIAGIPNGFKDTSLNAFDWQLPPLRTYRNALPPGIWNTLRNALEPDSYKRTPSLKKFWGDWSLGIDRIRERMSFTGKISYKQVAGETKTGIAKESLNLPNQDAFHLHSTKDALLAIVADGVTNSDFGTGDLASQLVIEGVDKEANNLLEENDPRVFQRLVRELFEDCSKKISMSAIALRPNDTSEGDLMTTTAILAKIDNRYINLAYVGDSRAYLLSHDEIEQLTIDGDLIHSCLMEGDSPEAAYGLGLSGKALSSFLGNSHIESKSSKNSTFEPRFARFPLIPGDAIVICTDGLIEEEVFLDPADVNSLVETHKASSIEECVSALVHAAAIRQRPRSQEEPNGFGDNITCVLVRVEQLIDSPKLRRKLLWQRILSLIQRLTNRLSSMENVQRCSRSYPSVQTSQRLEHYSNHKLTNRFLHILSLSLMLAVL